MSKADKDGWIRHRGGKCPVDAGVMVDVRHRDGEVFSGFEAVLDAPAGSWNHANHPGDIMAYKLHKPAERVTPAMPPEGYGEVVTETLSAVDGPFQWRDRITEIDSTASALAIERAELAQKLASEGFALIGRVVEPVEDMSDWRNWKAGDLVEYTGENDSTFYIAGVQYAVESIAHDFLYLDDESDGHHKWTHCKEFKWHSRPSA